MNRSETSSRHVHAGGANMLLAKRMGIDTRDESVVFMRSDCHVCRAEGFTAHSRVRLEHGSRAVIATINHVTSQLLAHDEAGLSESLWARLGVREGDAVRLSHASSLDSLGLVRGKIYGRTLSAPEFGDIISDIVAGQYSDIHVSSFVTACAARPLSQAEIIDLTRAMVDAGERLCWPQPRIVDKHCVGGLPGNRTTPIVVAIAAACGLTMPKTSSRAITSPAGTADTMETLAPVDLDLATIRRVVDREGGCVVWGGAVRLSPADDLLIRVERALDIDSEGQLVASVLSKKIAAGATDLVVDIPVGPTAKVRTAATAAALAESMVAVAAAFGLKLRCVPTDGAQPVGRGIGPALEARDVLAVLQNTLPAPADLRERALHLAGAVLEIGGAARAGEGVGLAASTLADGRAWAKFQRICEAQGGMRVPPIASHSKPIAARRSGRIAMIDNRHLAKVAKLAGAPDARAAGIERHVHVGDPVMIDQPLYTIHAETPGELAYALEYASANPDTVLVGGS